MAPADVSVIIPVLNEAKFLPALMEDLKSQEGVHLEIIAGDGGSADATRDILSRFGALIVSAKKGRGVQMNAAARQANGRYLLFLHADSRISRSTLIADALASLDRAVQKKGCDNIAGHFPLRFMQSTPRNPRAFRYLESKTYLNRPQTINGDQGCLISKTYFNRLGGFDETLPFLEDQKLAEKIREKGEWITLPGRLMTSARRFETEGFCRRYLLMAMIMGAFSTGMKDFFRYAPRLYPCPNETGVLLLTPYFRLIRWLMFRVWGIKGSVRTWYAVGRYVRRNCWQLFFFMDTVWRRARGTTRHPFLAFYDRHVNKWIDAGGVDAIAGVLCLFCFMGVSAAYFRIRERRVYSTLNKGL